MCYREPPIFLYCDQNTSTSGDLRSKRCEKPYAHYFNYVRCVRCAALFCMQLWYVRIRNSAYTYIYIIYSFSSLLRTPSTSLEIIEINIRMSHCSKNWLKKTNKKYINKCGVWRGVYVCQGKPLHYSINLAWGKVFTIHRGLLWGTVRGFLWDMGRSLLSLVIIIITIIIIKHVGHPRGPRMDSLKSPCSSHLSPVETTALNCLGLSKTRLCTRFTRQTDKQMDSIIA